MSGYCAVGRLTSDTVPRITVTIAITMATIGRLMKNFDIRYLPAALLVVLLAEATVAGAGCGFTGAPSRSFCRLSTITFAPGVRPPWTSQLLPIWGPSSIVVRCALLSLPAT